jgi:hypothetical protein
LAGRVGFAARRQSKVFLQTTDCNAKEEQSHAAEAAVDIFWVLRRD